jgi:hypothetical protein
MNAEPRLRKVMVNVSITFLKGRRIPMTLETKGLQYLDVNSNDITIGDENMGVLTMDY